MVKQLKTPKLTSDGPIECKGQGPRGIIAVLCIKECFILVQLKQGRVSVSCVSILILRTILGRGKQRQKAQQQPGNKATMEDPWSFAGLQPFDCPGYEV